MKKQKRILFMQYAALIFIAVVFAVPLIWLLLASIDLNAAPMIRFPETPTLANYVNVFTNPDNILGFWNSIIISVGTSVVTVGCALLASYPLSRYKLRGKQQFMYVILFMTSLPINAILVPVFKLFVNFGIQDSIISIILFLSATNLPYAIWMTKNFMDSVPISMEEAAKVDGATTMTALTKVILPLMKPGIFTVLIYVFPGVWGNFFVPFILLQSPDKFPASIRIYQYFQTGGLIDYGNLAAYSVIYMIPCVVLYAFAQKYMSQGFALGGADKG